MKKSITWDNCPLVRRIAHIYKEFSNGPNPKDDIAKIAEIVQEEFDRFGDIRVDVEANIISRTSIILKAFLEPHQTLFDSCQGFEGIVRLAIRTAQDPDYLGGLVFKIGMGGSEDLPTLRIPAQIIPAATIMERLYDLYDKDTITKMPTVHVFKANFAAVEINKLSEFKVDKSTRVSFMLLESYLKKFHPRIASTFIFDIELEWQPEFKELLKVLVCMIREAEPELSSSEAYQRIRTMGYNHGGEEGKKNSSLYTTLHPIYQEDFILPGVSGLFQTRKIGEGKYPSAVINVGGSPEKDFYEMRMFLRAKVICIFTDVVCPLNIQYFTRLCKFPGYYPARKGDILLSDHAAAVNPDFRNFKIQENSGIARDIQAINNDTNSLYWPFVADFCTKLNPNLI